MSPGLIVDQVATARAADSKTIATLRARAALFGVAADLERYAPEGSTWVRLVEVKTGRVTMAISLDHASRAVAEIERREQKGWAWL